MIEKNDIRHIDQMLEAIVRLEECYSKFSLEEACNDYMIFDVILMEFENLGNHSLKLSKELIDSHPELHLADLRAIRHRIAHDYLSVQIEILYQTIKDDFPKLKESLNSLINNQ